jgi:hypothetical protein
VSTSSAQTAYSITLDNTATGVTTQVYDDVIIDLSSIVQQDMSASLVTSLNDSMINGVSVIIPSGSYDDTITIDSSAFTNIWITNVPFENSFPEWEDFQGMCKEYPGLSQAYEKLKTFYDLCKDEWEHKKKESK